MLDQNTIDIVKSTAPVLDEHGETLTRHFYERMFANNPEVAPFFNPAHQAGGTQQRALAAAICAYAANIDNLEVLGEAVELIAQKHASLQIKPEHYPIVGENLLASISEVLGEAASNDILDAWAKAYGFLADIFIAREREIYETNARKDGGWSGFRRFKVVRKQPESEIITSFYLQPEDEGALPDFLAGQYVTVRVATPDGHTTMRNYSLSDASGNDYFRISVKREVAADCGEPGFVSNLLHDAIEEGAVLELAPPCGEFVLDPSEQHARPLVLLAAGIGITPIFSILKTALQTMPDRSIILVHACLNPQVQAFKATLDNLAQENPRLAVYYRYSDVTDRGEALGENASLGLVDADYVESLLPGKDADYYFCGPHPFMVNIYRDLLQWGIPGSQVHFEFFGPKAELESA